MPINCYTCQEEIVFDKNILSKTGKQIPLWPDKKNTHSHDEQGQPIRKPLPTPEYPASLEKQPARIAPTTGFEAKGESQGGGYMDTKRLRVMVEELQKQVNELAQKLESHVIIDSNRYENQMQIIYQKLGPLMDSTLTAAEMYNKQKKQQDPAEVQGWNSTPNNVDSSTPTTDEKNES
jgi:hypothetical protein